MSLITHMNLSRLDLETLRDALRASIKQHEDRERILAEHNWATPKEAWWAQDVAKCDRERAMLARVEIHLQDDSLRVKS